MRTLLPGEQHQQGAIVLLEIGHRLQHRAQLRIGIELLDDAFESGIDRGILPILGVRSSGHRPEATLLGAPVPSDQVGGDPEQPHPR
jgi:hypothetical protein